MFNNKSIFLILFLLFTLVGNAQNPLFNKHNQKKSTNDTVVKDKESSIVKSEGNNTFNMPPVFQKIFAKITILQSKLNKKFSALGNKINEEGSFSTVLLILLIAFIYGVIHAIGPGHGKFVVFSYFLSDDADIKKGVLLGSMIGFLHALSAIIVVFSVYFVLKISLSHGIEDASMVIKKISYGILVVFGLYILVHNIFHFKEEEQSDNTGNTKRNKIMPLAIAVGMIPCPGTTIILVFSISAGIILTGLFAALAMALGMGVTISVIGVLTIISKKGVLRFSQGNKKMSDAIIKSLSILGSLFIVLLGLVMFIGSF